MIPVLRSRNRGRERRALDVLIHALAEPEPVTFPPPEPLGWVVVATLGQRRQLTNADLMTETAALAEAAQWRHMTGSSGWDYQAQPVGVAVPP